MKIQSDGNFCNDVFEFEDVVYKEQGFVERLVRLC